MHGLDLTWFQELDKLFACQLGLGEDMKQGHLNIVDDGRKVVEIVLKNLFQDVDQISDQLLSERLRLLSF